jgi:hypothetical protein
MSRAAAPAGDREGNAATKCSCAVPDRYTTLPQKTRALIAWAYERGY